MASGHADYMGKTALYGNYSGSDLQLAVDDLGNIVALLKGMYGSVPTPIACDAGGNLQISLVASSATVGSLLTVGTIKSLYGVNVAAPGLPLFELVNLPFKCNIISIWIQSTIQSSTDIENDYVTPTMDGITYQNWSYKQLYEAGITQPLLGAFNLCKYDIVNGVVSMQLNGLLACATGFVLKYFNQLESARRLTYNVVYGQP